MGGLSIGRRVSCYPGVKDQGDAEATVIDFPGSAFRQAGIEAIGGDSREVTVEQEKAGCLCNSSLG